MRVGNLIAYRSETENDFGVIVESEGSGENLRYIVHWVIDGGSGLLSEQDITHYLKSGLLENVSDG